jgi:hypothetical protein
VGKSFAACNFDAEKLFHDSHRAPSIFIWFVLKVSEQR